MLPVTIGLGLINFNLLINSILGSRISEQAPSAIDRAFRIYMLPQGIFSVAVATVLFPALSRFAARNDMEGLRRTGANGVRQIALLLIPSAGATLAINIAVSAALYEPLGIAGVVIGTAAASAAMTVGQAYFLRHRLRG